MTENNIIIGIDTSCYTTSIAAISLKGNIIFNERVMLSVGKDEIGLRQSEAVFQHIKNLGEISERISELKKKFNICAVCASEKPRPIKNSYMPVFNVGLNFAKMLSSLTGCSFYKTTHQENHIEAAFIGNELKNRDKFISVHMSGGTMEILLSNYDNNGYKSSVIGGTKDISLGQLIDRTGVKMGYSFPAGKYIDENAVNCDEIIKNGLKTSVKEGYMNVSGLENQLDKLIQVKSREYVSKAVMDASVRCMYKSVSFLCDKYDIDEVLFAGGVASSAYIKQKLSKKLRRNNIIPYFAHTGYASDNACGCAIIGLYRFLGEQR